MTLKLINMSVVKYFTATSYTCSFMFSLTMVLSVAAFAQNKSPDDRKYQKMRLKMVEEQILTRGIGKGSVIKAMRDVPRHLFVPDDLRDQAYDDTPLPIGLEQTISQPAIVAYMTEAAGISKKDKVLEIGTGSGYQAAVLGEVAGEVYSIEILPEMADRAKGLLKELGYNNVHVKAGNGYLGWPDQAPFDAILVTAAPEEIPQVLIDQLAVGGKMVIPVGTTIQEMVVITKTKNGLNEKRTMPVRFVPMTGKPNQ